VYFSEKRVNQKLRLVTNCSGRRLPCQLLHRNTSVTNFRVLQVCPNSLSAEVLPTLLYRDRLAAHDINDSGPLRRK